MWYDLANPQNPNYIIPVYWWWKSRDLIGLDIELARLKRVIMHCWYDNALLARVQILFVYERWVVVRRDTDSELFELSEEDFLSMRQYFMRNYEGNFESNPVIAYLFKSSPTTCTKVNALRMHEIGPSIMVPASARLEWKHWWAVLSCHKNEASERAYTGRLTINLNKNLSGILS